MARERREVWAKRVERWKESGLTAAEFAAEMGLNPRTLAHWKWYLGRERASRPQPTPPKFVEVVTPTAIATDPAADKTEPLELVLRDGLVVRVPPRFDQAALHRLLVALAGR